MVNQNKLTDIAEEVRIVVLRELTDKKIKFDSFDVHIYPIKNVGVQGDERTYAYPTEIELLYKKKFVWDCDFLENLSTKITNEVKDVNRVVYLLGKRD